MRPEPNLLGDLCEDCGNIVSSTSKSYFDDAKWRCDWCNEKRYYQELEKSDDIDASD